MGIENNSQESIKNEKAVLAWQYRVFFALFILVIPITLFSLYGFNGSMRYVFLPLSIPIFYIGISSIKNQVSILRLKRQKEPSRGKQAVIFGYLAIGVGIIQLFFTFIPSLLNIVFNFMSFGFINPSPKFYDTLPIYNKIDQMSDIYQFNKNSSFIENHTFTNISAWGDYKSIPLAINDNSVFIAGSIGQTNGGINLALISADNSTGKINWQTIAGSGFIALDSKHIYAQAPNSFLNSAVSVVAYDINSGSEVWKATLDWKYALGIDDMVITPQSLGVATINHDNSEFYLIDPESGKVQASFKNQGKYTLFMIDDGTFYDWDGKYITAAGKINWKTQVFDKNYLQPSTDTIAPIVTSGFILVKSGHRSYSPITALRENDGSIVWKFDQNVVSNIAIDGSTSYFVTENAQLIAVNTQTGEVLGVVDFNPKFEQIFDFVNTSIYITAHNRVIAVYFENTNQITIMRFSPQ